MTHPNTPTPTPLPPQAEVAPSPRPRKAWLAFFILGALLIVAIGMLFVGKHYGDDITKNVSQFWRDITGASADDGHEHEDGKFYTCGMHPWVILPTEGLCPICHMDLTPLDPSKFTGEIAIDPVLMQNIGVRVATVDSGPLVRTLRTVGKIDYDETALEDVNLKIGGWIEELHVDYLGAAVEKGAPLFELYSPDLVSAQQEFLLARRQLEQPPVPFVPRIATDSQSQVQAARTRLTWFGIDDAQIDELERTGTLRKTMTIRSPYTGTVINKMAVAGMRVDSGMRMYRIANLDRVWVTVTVYENQLPFVELGQEAKMTLSYLPGQEFIGKVTYVYPWTDEKTRQVNVRLEFANEHGLLKPGMFANVELRRTLAADRTLVSRSAVLDTGARQVAFVSLGGGRFEPRDLRLGVETDKGMVEVLDGLKPGEQVVTSAQFLLDSESKIREGLLRMLRGDLVGAPGGGDEVGPELESLPPALGTALSQALADYLSIADQLASDSTDDIAAPAHRLAAGVDAMLEVTIPGDEHFWHTHDEVATVRGKALELESSADIAAARLAFTDLSIALTKLLRTTGVPKQHDSDLEELHCPMFLENQGGSSWLQNSGSVRNPYFGAKMLTCFDRRSMLPIARAPGAAPLTAPIDALVAAYLRASALLAGDKTAGLSASWADLREQVKGLIDEGPPPVADLARRVETAIPADELDIAAARTAFDPLSTAVIELVRVQPTKEVLERAYCPMVEASWLQVGSQLRNPYMGSRMLECGDIEETLPARGDGR